MNVLRRHASSLLVLTLMLGVTAAAQAQVLKQLPADPWVVFKFNNLQNTSNKLGAMAQKLGLANLDPAFADPLGTLKKQLNIQQGLDDKGELAIAIYPPTEDDPDGQILALVPVTDYQAFIKSLPNLKTEGDVSTFTMPDDDDPIYVVNRGSHAAFSPVKALVDQKAAGLNVEGLAAKQLASNDVTTFVNARVLGAKYLPEFQAARENIIKGLEDELAAGGPMQKKFAPAIKVLANQALNFVEHTLKEGQAATLGLNIVDQGVNLTGVAEFTPSSYLGQTVSSLKSGGNSNMLVGLPDRQYFVFGGGTLDPEVTKKIVNDAVAPVRKELEGVEGAQPILAMVDGIRNTLEAMKGFSTGWVVPAEGQTELVQQVAVYNGDAKKIQEAQRAYIRALGDVMKMIPDAPEVQAQVQPDAKTLDGTKLDQVNVQFKFDTNTPEGAQAAQAFAMIYGQQGVNAVMGPVNDQTFIVVSSGNEDLVKSVVTAASKQENALGNRPNIKAVADQLPKGRVIVFYVALDNIINQVTKFMGQMGMAIPVKLPADMHPIGVAVGAEGSAVRVDAHVSNELISNLISAGIQASQMMNQGDQQKPGAP